MAIFSQLEVWVDRVSRTGEEHMAVDEIIHSSGLKLPLLRFYQWTGEEVSLGYFEKLADAKRDFPGKGVEYVRRWTGGGIVDHRIDQTYTLFIPRGNKVEQLRGAGSYEKIHEALAASLIETGVECSLTLDASDSSARSCFVNPVPYDIVGGEGQKLAGAGQRRTRDGLIHQGSVQGVLDVNSWRSSFTKRLSSSATQKNIDETDLGDVSEMVAKRYGSETWLNKR